ARLNYPLAVGVKRLLDHQWPDAAGNVSDYFHHVDLLRRCGALKIWESHLDCFCGRHATQWIDLFI
ncbi:hypothetical protein CEE86_14790, partial [Lactobacillus crispatus]